jgi:hypothetical protein
MHSIPADARDVMQLVERLHLADAVCGTRAGLERLVIVRARWDSWAGKHVVLSLYTGCPSMGVTLAASSHEPRDGN